MPRFVNTIVRAENTYKFSHFFLCDSNRLGIFDSPELMSSNSSM